jgi:nucleoside 2-deoxyribosyltransferase
MRLYIASHSQDTARRLKDTVEAAGHTVVSQWVTADLKFSHCTATYTHEERISLALLDEADVRRSDALILMAEEEGNWVPGGKHVETGIALALGKPVVVLGHRENVFHWHPRVQIASTVDELLKMLSDAKTTT